MVDIAQIERFVTTLYGQARGCEGVHAFVTALDPSIPGGEKRVATRELPTVIGHAERHDRPGRGVYACVNMLRASEQKRSKDALGLLVAVHVDLDFKDIEASPEEALAAVAGLSVQPTMCVFSGGGLHLYWVLSDPLEATTSNIELLESLNERAADMLGAATQTRDVSRLLRIPGTHNSKRALPGDAGQMVVISETIGSGEVHDVDDLDEWLSVQGPVLRARETEARSHAAPENPWLAVARAQGFKPSIDVEQRLAAMSFGAAGDASIHQTQLQVSASMIAKGHAPEEVRQVLLDATRGAAGSYGDKWNWRREEANIAKIVAGAVAKFQPLAPKPKVEPRSASVEAGASPKLVANGGEVVPFERREKPEKKAKIKASKGETPMHIVVGNAVIETMKERGVGVVFTPKGAWRCTDGVWSLAADGLKGWLDVEIEKACRAIGVETANRLVSEARAYVSRDPDLWREHVAWDMHGKIPTLSGLVDPVTLDVEPLRPEHHCTWRIPAKYDPAAACPWWALVLEEGFADREAGERAEIVGVLQEIAGAGLIDVKSKALSKALILVGGSNCGKSVILDVMGGLHGDEPIAAGLDALEGSHGLMSFVRRAPWVLHEAFDQRKWHFSSGVKAIVEGKPVHINVKNGPMLNQRIRAPIFWGTNYPPQFREATRAIVNRMVIVTCRREFVEDELVGAGIEAKRLGYDSPASLVLATELPGLLNWAIAGLQRALNRGFIEQSAEMRETADEVHRDSNLAAGFIDDCVEFDATSRLSVPDFCAAFSVWWLESKGEDRRTPSNESISKAVIALGERRIAYHPKELRDNRRRYYAGIRFNASGVEFWERAVESDLFEGKTASTTEKTGSPNGSIPEAWKLKPAILAMVAAFRGKPKETKPNQDVRDGVSSGVSWPKTTDTLPQKTDTRAETDTRATDTFNLTDTELTPQLTRADEPRERKDPLF